MTDLKPVVTDLPDASPSDPLEALSWLGNSVEEIAEGLRARGIKGKVSQYLSCPLSNYLRVFGFEVAVDVSTYEESMLHLNAEMVKAPALVQFILRFDDEELPDLIEP